MNDPKWPVEPCTDESWLRIRHMTDELEALFVERRRLQSGGQPSSMTLEQLNQRIIELHKALHDGRLD